MTIKDPFSYSDRWDSIGLDCSDCTHQANADYWPNRQRDYKCGLHDVPLRVQLAMNGYKQGEWFCKDFENNGKANRDALKEFENIRPLLEVKMLYVGYGKTVF